MARNSRPDLNAELRVDKERFPYRVYLGNRLIASLYTHTLIDAIKNTIKNLELTNDLIREYNFLVDVVKGRDTVDPDSVVYKKLVEVPHDTEGDDFFKAYGIKLEQVWKTKGSYHHYTLEEIDVTLMTVTLKWIGTYKYIRVVEIEVLKKKYELVENPNLVLIKAVTKERQK